MHGALADQLAAARLDGRAVVSGTSPGQWPEEADRVVLGAIPLPVAGDDLFPLPLTAAGSGGSGGDLGDRVAHRGPVLPGDRGAEQRVAGHRAQVGLLVRRAEDAEPGYRESGGPDRDVAPQGPFAGQRHQMRLGERGRSVAGCQLGGGTRHHGTSILARLPRAAWMARPPTYTARSLRMAAGSSRGLPSTAMTSASKPGAMRPFRCPSPQACAAREVIARKVSAGPRPAAARSTGAYRRTSCGLAGETPASLPATSIAPDSYSRRRFAPRAAIRLAICGITVPAWSGSRPTVQPTAICCAAMARIRAPGAATPSAV